MSLNAEFASDCAFSNVLVWDADVDDFLNDMFNEEKALSNEDSTDPAVAKSTSSRLVQKSRKKLDVNSKAGQKFAASKAKAGNSSITQNSLRLRAFPDFHKCDALQYFPSTLARHLNSGDFSSLHELLKMYLHDQCSIEVHCDSTVKSVDFLGLLELFSVERDLYPDLIMCMHSSKVVGKEVRGRLYWKCTNNWYLHDSLRRTVTASTSTNNTHIFTGTRADRINMNMNLRTLSAQKMHELRLLMESGEDVVMYGHMDLQLLFCHDVKSVTSLKILCEMSSVVPAT